MKWSKYHTTWFLDRDDGGSIGYLKEAMFHYAENGKAGMVRVRIPTGLTLDETKAWALAIYRMAQ